MNPLKESRAAPAGIDPPGRAAILSGWPETGHRRRRPARVRVCRRSAIHFT